jgi:hypothetical protein
MEAPVTLRQLLEQHPEWADLPMVIARGDGDVDWVGAAGMVYPGLCEESDTTTTTVLVFAPN